MSTTWSQVRSSSAVTAPVDGLGEAAAAEVGVGQDVADDREPGARADHVGAGGGDQAAGDADAVVDAVGDRRRRQPRREAELVQPVELADVDRQQPLDRGRVRPEVRAVDPHPDHLRPGVDAVVRARRPPRLLGQAAT